MMTFVLDTLDEIFFRQPGDTENLPEWDEDAYDDSTDECSSDESSEGGLVDFEDDWSENYETASSGNEEQDEESFELVDCFDHQCNDPYVQTEFPFVIQAHESASSFIYSESTGYIFVHLSGCEFGETFKEWGNNDIFLHSIFIEVTKDLMEKFCPLTGYTVGDNILFIFPPPGRGMPIETYTDFEVSKMTSYAAARFNHYLHEYSIPKRPHSYPISIQKEVYTGPLKLIFDDDDDVLSGKECGQVYFRGLVFLPKNFKTDAMEYFDYLTYRSMNTYFEDMSDEDRRRFHFGSIVKPVELSDGTVTCTYKTVRYSDDLNVYFSSSFMYAPSVPELFC